MIKLVNTTAVEIILLDHLFREAGSGMEEYEIPPLDVAKWAEDDGVLKEIGNNHIQLYSNGELAASPTEAINVLKGLTPREVTPTVPKNDRTLRPLGMIKKVFQTATYAQAIVLSNKNGNTFNYVSSIVPEEGAFIAQDNLTKLSKVVSVNALTLSVTLEDDTLGNGNAILSNPFPIRYELPTDSDIYELWGLRLRTLNEDKDDFAELKILDTYNMLGYGNMFVVKTYERTWISCVNSGRPVLTPDNSPGDIPQTFTFGMCYYTFNLVDTFVEVWLDYIVTVQDG